MALLSVTDVLLFFTLIMNAVAIAKPRGGLLPNNRNAPNKSSSANATDDASVEEGSRDTDPLVGMDSAPGPTGSVYHELLGRAGSLLMAFRRCGVFIAIWNVTLMVAMVLILP